MTSFRCEVNKFPGPVSEYMDSAAERVYVSSRSHLHLVGSLYSSEDVDLVLSGTVFMNCGFVGSPFCSRAL